ncbi:MAG: glycosyltransferase family 2 protein [Gammaproteobacteria bacterium]
MAINSATGPRGHLASLNIAKPGPNGNKKLVSLVLLEAPGLSRTRIDSLQLLEPKAEPGSGRRVALPAPGVTPGQLIDTVAAGAKPRAEQVLDFLLNEGWRRSAALRTDARAQRVLHSLLASTARSDGVAQTVSSPRRGDVFVQCRATQLNANVRYLVSEANGLAVEACEVATVADEGAHGNRRAFVLLIAGSRDLNPNRLQRLYFRNAQGWFALEVPEEVRRLEGPSALAHARELIPRMRGSDRIVARLTELARPRYERRNTLTEMAALPVRLTVNHALSSTQGMLLVGFLLDPKRLVTCVMLRSDSTLEERLDASWLRSERPDVSKAFAEVVPFAGRLIPGEDRHGFVVHVPAVAAGHSGVEFYIELTFRDGSIAFVPLVVRLCPTQADLRSLLSHFNPKDRCAASQLEHHLAPFVRAACADAHGTLESNTVAAFGPAPALRDFTVLMPVTSALAQLDACLAQLAVHGDTHGRLIVVVVPDSVGAELSSRASRLAEFYGHSVVLLGCDGAPDRVSALQLAAEYAETDWLLALAPDIYAHARGWVAALERAADETPGLDFVSPSLLYEDGSIRFAGRAPAGAVDLGTLLCGQSPPALRSNYEGYPRAWLARAASQLANQSAPGASLLCCLMRTAAFASVAESTASYVEADAREALFWERAAQGGYASAWTPAVELTALDETLELPQEHWRMCASIVDRWNLAADLGRQAAGAAS